MENKNLNKGVLIILLITSNIFYSQTNISINILNREVVENDSITIEIKNNSNKKKSVLIDKYFLGGI